MDSYGTQKESTLKIIGTALVGSLYFWIALVGFVFSIWGFVLTHEAFFGLGYGFFGIVLASCIFSTSVQARRGGPKSRRGGPPDYDIFD